MSFQSTSPVWRTTAAIEGRRYIGIISIHVPRVEDDRRLPGDNAAHTISIHVPRVEDDKCFAKKKERSTTFQSTSPVWRTTREGYHGLYVEMISIHVPRVEDDSEKTLRSTSRRRFQSTSPVWRTTVYSATWSGSDIHFNPRPPCGGRLPDVNDYIKHTVISIHVPRVEDDTKSFPTAWGGF